MKDSISALSEIAAWASKIGLACMLLGLNPLPLFAATNAQTADLPSVEKKTDRKFGSTSEIPCFPDGRMKTTENGIVREKAASYCWRAQPQFLLHERCMRGEACEATTRKRVPANARTALREFGNPLFHSCDLAGGRARIVNLWNGSEWRETSICIFKDESFIGLEQWEAQYLELR